MSLVRISPSVTPSLVTSSDLRSASRYPARRVRCARRGGRSTRRFRRWPSPAGSLRWVLREIVRRGSPPEVGRRASRPRSARRSKLLCTPLGGERNDEQERQYAFRRFGLRGAIWILRADNRVREEWIRRAQRTTIPAVDGVSLSSGSLRPVAASQGQGPPGVPAGGAFGSPGSPVPDGPGPPGPPG
jgi:hypothetical protein